MAHKYVKLSKQIVQRWACGQEKLTWIDFAYDWLIEISRILKAHMDYSEEQHYDLLIRNTTIQLCLSIQNSLGFQGEFEARTFSGKFAWLVLQLRNVVVLMSMAANVNVPSGPGVNDKTSPLEDPGQFPPLLCLYVIPVPCSQCSPWIGEVGLYWKTEKIAAKSIGEIQINQFWKTQQMQT